MGRTGETYAVGPDRLFRSNSRFAQELGVEIDDHQSRRSRSTPPPVRIAPRRRPGRARRSATDYRGTPVLSSWRPVVVHRRCRRPTGSASAGRWSRRSTGRGARADPPAPAFGLSHLRAHGTGRARRVVGDRPAAHQRGPAAGDARHRHRRQHARPGQLLRGTHERQPADERGRRADHGAGQPRLGRGRAGQRQCPHRVGIDRQPRGQHPRDRQERPGRRHGGPAGGRDGGGDVVHDERPGPLEQRDRQPS